MLMKQMQTDKLPIAATGVLKPHSSWQDHPVAPTFHSKTTSSPYTIRIYAPCSEEELDRERGWIERQAPNSSDWTVLEAMDDIFEPLDGRLISDSGLTTTGTYLYRANATYYSGNSPVPGPTLPVTLP